MCTLEREASSDRSAERDELMREDAHMRALVVRIGFCVALVGVLGVTAGPAFAHQVPEGPTLVVSNPNPGDMLTPGAMVIEGVAFDPTATTGTGVDRVSVFLDNRDTGGLHLGDATLGGVNFLASEPAQFATAGWMLTTVPVKGAGDGHTLFVYARSAVSGDETVMEIPVVIGDTVHKSSGGVFEEATPGTSDIDAPGQTAD
jgi:hypothetical protein